eukprot:symbB.v1.2.000720.t1/scaffold40.1/size395337/24
MEHDNATKRAASSTDPECPVKKQRIKTEVGALPLATGYEVQKTYYKHFVEKWQGQQDVSIVSALPQLPQPSQEELGRISYHAELRLDGTKSTPRLWLKKPQLNSYSKRCFDRWGSDRFLFVNIPQRFPDFHGSQLGRFDFLDRSFRFLVPKLQSSYGKDAKESGGGSSVVAIFFAETGETGLETCRVEEVREWHFPLRLAKSMRVCKYAERFKLAFSDITQTLEVEADQIEVREDLRGCRGLGAPLTDGNGLASADVFEAIAALLGHRGRRISAVQIRLGPAKGMLVRSDQLGGQRIVLFRAQVKYGDASYYENCEPCQRTIEVCSSGVVFADQEQRHQRLNSQLILVLHALGCSADVFLDLEKENRKLIADLLINTRTFVMSDFFPSANAAGASGSDLCYHIHAMHAAGMDHHSNQYLFYCIRLYIHAQLQQVREGHVPCPDTYMLTMISDFSRQLGPTSMSAWIAGRGFLLGPHLVTRIPCAHPSDIILVNGVDDFAQRSPGFAYENLAVMSAHESLSCSPASRMSGGDYDGDKAFIIGFQPLVNEVKVTSNTKQLESCDPSGTGEADPMHGEYRTETVNGEQANLHAALQRVCVQLASDLGTYGKLNIMWMSHADHDISRRGHFDKNTHVLVKLQELAIDAAKTGWRVKDGVFQALQNQLHLRRPHWLRPNSPGGLGGTPAHSSSALGRLFDLEEEHQKWMEAWAREGRKLSNFFIHYVIMILQEDLVQQYASEVDLLLEPVTQQLSKMKSEVHDVYMKLWEDACIVHADCRVYAKNATSNMSFAQAAKEAREWLRSKTLEEGLSHETMALVAYKETSGSPICWELCLQDLCHFFATTVLQRDVTPVLRGGAVVLRVARFAAHDGGGPSPLMPEEPRFAPGLRNLKELARSRAPPDDGNLAHVCRNEAFLLPVDELRWTHQEPSDHFKDGKSVNSLVEDLYCNRVKVDADFLVLDVVCFDEKKMRTK